MSGKVIRCDIYDVFMYEAFYAIWYHLYNLKMWKIVLVKRTFIKVAVCFFFIFIFSNFEYNNLYVARMISDETRDPSNKNPQRMVPKDI